MSATTHRATQENGPSVIAGRLIWTSATGITTADPLSYGGCLRKWFFDQVLDLKGPPTAAMTGGTALHTEIENHLKTGAPLQSPLALAGRVFIPHPGSGLFIEKPIHFTTSLGVDIYGHVDLYNMRQQYIDSEGVLQQDPPWSMEVKDWKTTSSFDYCKTERELGDNIQLNTYSEAGFRMWPDLEHTRHTHAYFLTRGRPASKLVTIRRSREDVARRWNYAESVIRTMADAAGASSPDHVTPNTKSCDAYRGCPHRERCSAYKATSLDSLYSKVAGDWNSPAGSDVQHQQQETKTVGILANNPNLMTAPAAPQPDMRQQLANEEAQMRAQQQQLQAAQAAPQNPVQAIAAACQRIMAHGRGFPTIAGNAAQPYSMTLNLQQPVQPGYVFQGQGQLAGVTLNEVQHFEQLAKELDDQRAQMPSQITTPVAQAVQAVQQAAAPLAAPTQFTQPFVMQQGALAVALPVQGMSLLPPNAPQSQPQLAAAPPKSDEPRVGFGPDVVVGTPHPVAEESKKGRGRPKKNATDATPEVVAATPPPLTASAPAMSAPPATASPSPESEGGLSIRATYAPTIICINARVAGHTSKSLANYVDYINSELSKRYCVGDDGKPGMQDVRCAPSKSILAFGGWKGAVREVVKSGAGLDGLEGTTMHLDTFMDDLNEAVADALRVVCENRGWIYIRGVR